MMMNQLTTMSPEMAAKHNTRDRDNCAYWLGEQSMLIVDMNCATLLCYRDNAAFRTGATAGRIIYCREFHDNYAARTMCRAAIDYVVDQSGNFDTENNLPTLLGMTLTRAKSTRYDRRTMTLMTPGADLIENINFHLEHERLNSNSTAYCHIGEQSQVIQFSRTVILLWADTAEQFKQAPTCIEFAQFDSELMAELVAEGIILKPESEWRAWLSSAVTKVGEVPAAHAKNLSVLGEPEFPVKFSVLRSWQGALTTMTVCNHTLEINQYPTRETMLAAPLHPERSRRVYKFKMESLALRWADLLAEVGELNLIWMLDSLPFTMVDVDKKVAGEEE